MCWHLSFPRLYKYTLSFVSDTSVTQLFCCPTEVRIFFSDSFIALVAYAVLYLRCYLCHQQSHLFTPRTTDIDIVGETTIKNSFLLSAELIPHILPIWTRFPSDLPCSSRAIHAAQATATPTSVSSSTQILPACKHIRIRSAPFVTVGKLIGCALSPPTRR